MKQSLQIKLGQHLSMTPQLQQAIKLLQLSSLELELEVRTALESNSLLEYEENDSDDSETENEVDELELDSEWDEIYLDYKKAAPSENNDFETWHSEEVNLQDHLLWQLNLTPLSERENEIAECIIDSIDDDGYLQCELPDIQNSLLPELQCEIDEIEAILHKIHYFDPLAVGSRSLRECLQIQLGELDQSTPHLAKTAELVNHHLNLLGNKNFGLLKTKLKVTDDVLQAIVSILTSLNPKPGLAVTSNRSEFIIPDVVVTRRNNNWIVQLNREFLPRLRINPSYAAMVKRADTSRDNKFLQEQLTEAKWFLKSLQHRNETLLKVAHFIVDSQQEFLEAGAMKMKPMILSNAAEALDLHESTISRVTTQKFIDTPQGVFELKYFFSSHVRAESGNISSTAIKAMLKKIIGEEPHNKPFSDNQIVNLLADQGIMVARRTVAKYREAMGIPPSNQRKSLG